MRDPWFPLARPRQEASLRLYCFPYAGGGAAVFRAWPDHLPDAVDVYAVQLPGRETRLREPAFTRMEDVVRALAPLVLAHGAGPCAFFGHSLGGLVAFALARELREAHAAGPAHLLVAGARAPQQRALRVLHDLPGPGFRAELARLGGTPPAVLASDELMDLFEPLLRADFAVSETYADTSGATLDVPITVFGGEEDDEVAPERLDAWRERTTAACDVHLRPGGHFFLETDRPGFLRAVADELARHGTVPDAR